MDYGDVASTVISLGALFFSIFSFWRTRGLRQQQHKLMQIQEETEKYALDREKKNAEAEKESDITAHCVNEGKNKEKLRIANKGRGIAYNVKVTPCGDTNPVVTSDLNRAFPMEKLDPGGSVDTLMSVSLNSDKKFSIEIEWLDEKNIKKSDTKYITI